MGREKTMKLTARGFAETVSFIFFRRGRQFDYFSRTHSGRFHNFSHFNSKTTVSFNFEPMKLTKKTVIFRQFHVKLATKKKVRFIAKTFR